MGVVMGVTGVIRLNRATVLLSYNDVRGMRGVSLLAATILSLSGIVGSSPPASANFTCKGSNQYAVDTTTHNTNGNEAHFGTKASIWVPPGGGMTPTCVRISSVITPNCMFCSDWVE